MHKHWPAGLGGRIVKDDLIPLRMSPLTSPSPSDAVKRRFFASETRLISAEVVLPDVRNSLLVGTRAA